MNSDITSLLQYKENACWDQVLYFSILKNPQLLLSCKNEVNITPLSGIYSCIALLLLHLPLYITNLNQLISATEQHT